MLKDPERRSKVLHNSVLHEDDFDSETIDIAPREVVQTLKVAKKPADSVLKSISEQLVSSYIGFCTI